MKKNRFARALKALNSFFLCFLIIGFAVTCCLMLFVQTMASTIELTLTDEVIALAAKLTLLNVLLLTLLLTVADILRRKLTVDRSDKRITEAAQKIMQGDFSVRLPVPKNAHANGHFDEIAICINQMAEELSHTETLRTDFVASVSHEIKTPLAVMQNYATMLSAPDLPEDKRREYAKVIGDAARRLAALVTNILRLNKLENQQIAPTPKAYDLSEQICSSLLEFEEIWSQKGVNIETDIEDGVHVYSDPELMNLVWNNLFSNAIKFTEREGTVSVSVKPMGESAVVTVRDTGCGIPPEVGKRIFDKFYQGDTSHATEGNGLGLALVKRAIDITENDISVESEVGRGSCFTVRMRRLPS
ncbi:MAG: HAMP domain-containing histidine kinase [Clostridia bacterium]|nr:HAMP domain-containing histidine kinase [Clostridia bacterium]